ncbi:hypothetical protein A8L34_28455 [Bacillus sp. FJAT-27264]|nr:hypothetical protein A8L34_28455 [Bacillus sp. FJAT-27264]
MSVVQRIADNYIQMEKSIVNQLTMSSQHNLTMGGFREGIWQSMFEQIIPKKFSIERSVFIIDSNGEISNEVDLAIFDEQYTPYIFNYGQLKYIPIEAVAVVVQCKSKEIKSGDLEVWVKSITKLKTSLNSIARMQFNMTFGEDLLGRPRTQSSTRPIRILCCTREKDFTENHGAVNNFDFILHPSNKGRLKIVSTRELSSLKDWYISLNHANPEYTNREPFEDGEKFGLDKYVVQGTDGEDISLLSLAFQLNQLLMLINNPLLFPHRAYADMFNKELSQLSTSDRG